MNKNIYLNSCRFTKINYNTQRAKSIIARYVNSNLSDLNQCYENCSTAKYRAFNYCIDKAHKASDNYLNYNGMYITGYNCNFFSCACTVTVNNKNYLLYFTHNDDYAIEFE